MKPTIILSAPQTPNPEWKAIGKLKSTRRLSSPPARESPKGETNHLVKSRKSLSDPSAPNPGGAAMRRVESKAGLPPLPVQNYNMLRTLYRTRKDIQKLKNQCGNRLGAWAVLGKSAEEIELSWAPILMSSCEKTEGEIEKRMLGQLMAFETYRGFLGRIRGVGPVISAGLIGMAYGQKHTKKCLRERAKYFAKKEKGEGKRARVFQCGCPVTNLTRFGSRKKLRKYCGLAPGSKMLKGPEHEKNRKFSPRLKEVAYHLGQEFLKRVCPSGRVVYDYYYANKFGKRDDLTKGLKIRYTMNRAVQDFMDALYGFERGDADGKIRFKQPEYWLGEIRGRD